MPSHAADGIIGFEPPGRGQQTGHLVVARSPSWDGFVQCDTCNLPRQYEDALQGAGAYRVARTGEYSCGHCRRRAWAPRTRWYALQLRVFAPPAKPGGLPQRVVPLLAFAWADDTWPTHGQVASHNAWLRGYADYRIDRIPVYDLGVPCPTPWGRADEVRGTRRALAICYQRGAGRAFFEDGGLPQLVLP